MSSSNSQTSLVIPLKPDAQEKITASELAKLIMELLRRNWTMPATERSYAISYYPFSLAALRSFEIIGYANPEAQDFAYKWNEAVAILRSKAMIMPDPTQGDRPEFMVPTSIGLKVDLNTELGLVVHY